MFSSPTKICLLFLSIFILFQLNNCEGLCVGKGYVCGSGGRQCCDKLICNGGSCDDCPPLGAPCTEDINCCAGQSCQHSQCHTCLGKGATCEPKNNPKNDRCCGFCVKGINRCK
ncbi:unnamed protein product [Meloidogyne enterolobii]|uniref:Uncharacterized protein n=1 Tax=Meloidogyne enterolobii TaxID=390850 RepID=A0ACB0ZJQ4_MELEN